MLIDSYYCRSRFYFQEASLLSVPRADKAKWCDLSALNLWYQVCATKLDLSRRKKGSPKVYLLRFYVFKARHAPTRTSFTTSRLLFGRLSDEEQLWRLSGFSVSCITGPVQKIETFPNRTRLAEEITTMSCKQCLIIVLSSAE